MGFGGNILWSSKLELMLFILQVGRYLGNWQDSMEIKGSANIVSNSTGIFYQVSKHFLMNKKVIM